jgi:hypothetical protein
MAARRKTKTIVPTVVAAFISHSSQDHVIAEAVVNLLRTAFRFRAAEILCTSVDGHKLAGGADTEEELRSKVREAGILISIITPASVTSSYVLFELGARWGCNRPFIPLLAAGLKPSDLREPLKSKNALQGHRKCRRSFGPASRTAFSI